MFIHKKTIKRKALPLVVAKPAPEVNKEKKAAKKKVAEAPAVEITEEKKPVTKPKREKQVVAEPQVEENKVEKTEE